MSQIHTQRQMERPGSENFQIRKRVWTIWENLQKVISGWIRWNRRAGCLQEALILQWVQICQQQTRGYAHTAKPCWGMRSLEENSDWRRSFALPFHLLHLWARRGSWSFPWVFVHDNLAWDKRLAWKMNNTFLSKNYFLKTRGRQWISHFFLSENTTFIVSSSSKE